MTRPLMVRIRFIEHGSRVTPHVTESMKIRYLIDDSCYRWTVYARKSESVESVLRRVGAQMVLEDRDNVLCRSCDPRGRMSQFRFHSTLKSIKCRGICYEDSDAAAMATLMGDAIGNVVAKSNDCLELTESFKWTMGPVAMVLARKYRPFPDNEPWFRRDVGPDLVVEPVDSLESLAERLPSYDSSERINSTERLSDPMPPGYEQIVSGKRDLDLTLQYQRPPKVSIKDHYTIGTDKQIPRISSEPTLREKVLAIDNRISDRILSDSTIVGASKRLTELSIELKPKPKPMVAKIQVVRLNSHSRRPKVSIV